MNFDDRPKCPDCGGTGAVGIYAHATVREVKRGNEPRTIYTAVAVCTCAVADAKYGAVEHDGRPIGRYFPEGYCKLPKLFYSATAETRAEDMRTIREWLDWRGMPRVGEFTVEDWRG